MKKLMFFANIIFIILSVVLLALLVYIGTTKGFTIVIIISMFVMLVVGIYSAIQLIKEG